MMTEVNSEENMIMGTVIFKTVILERSKVRIFQFERGLFLDR